MMLSMETGGKTGTGSEGYPSALDVGGGGLPKDTLPAEGQAPSLSGVGAVDRLADAIKVAILDAKGGAATIDEIQQTVNANMADGAHYPGGVVEAKIHEMEASGVLARQGDAYGMADGARAEIEDPAAVVRRRAEVLGTMFINLQPEGSDFSGLEGVTAAELAVYMRAETLTPTGFEPRDYSVEVLTRDLDALVAASVLVKRTAAEEEAVRSGESGAARGDVSGEDVEEETDGEVEEDAFDETADEDEHEEGDDAAAADGPAPAYTFAPGMMPRLANMGALTLAVTSVPKAAADVAAAATASTTERTIFERKLAAELEAEKAKTAQHEAFVARLRAHLATKKLEFLIDEVVGKPLPSPQPAVVYFDYTQTVQMNAAEQVIILREVKDIERQLAEEEARIDGAKMAANSAKTTGKERIEELKNRKEELLAMSDGTERTYTVQAYTELDTSGPQTISRIRAKADGRVLKEEVLKPSEALKAMAQSQVQAPMPSPAAETTAPAPTPPSASTPSPAPAAPQPAPDAATQASAAAAEQKAQAAAAVTPSPVGKVQVSVAGLLPFVLEAIIVAGSDGIPRERLTDAVIGITCLKVTGGVEAFIGKAAEKLVAGDEVELRDGVLVFDAKKTVLGLVVDAGDTGLREDDLLHAFCEETQVREVDAVAAALLAGVEAAIAGGDLSRGPLPGTMGALLWLSGETDPRRIDDDKDATTPQAAPAKRARGAKGTAGSDGAAKKTTTKKK